MNIDLMQVRYRYDDLSFYGLTPLDPGQHAWVHSRGLSQNLRVSERVLPTLLHAAMETASRLEIRESITVFVYASGEANAFCCSETDRSHILVFVSSFIVRHLKPLEWYFILGHELGHHMLGHMAYPKGDGPQLDLRALELSRAAELSADRAGLIACADVEVALRATLKIASGLDDKYLVINVADYIRQVTELCESAGDEGILYSTHPPFPIRARAMLRFDSVLVDLSAGAEVTERLRQIDDEIQRDLDGASCGVAGNRFTELAKSAAFWAVAESVCENGVFSVREQSLMAQRFGDDRVAALKRMLGAAASKTEAVALLRDKSNQARAQLQAAPSLAVRTFERLLSEVADR